NAEKVCWRAVGDRPRLRQVVYNLLENAVNFTPAGGRVDVTVEDDTAALQIKVRDTGVGFAPDFVPKLLSRFQSRGRSSTRLGGGLGLGLALAKELVELHGGRITADSAGPGLGAAFTVTLPHTQPSAGA